MGTEKRPADWRVGLFFHTFENGKLQHQGVVQKEMPGGAFKIAFFSWFDGELNSSRVVPREWFGDARFYETDEEMVAAGASIQQQNPDDAVEDQRSLKRVFGQPVGPAKGKRRNWTEPEET